MNLYRCPAPFPSICLSISFVCHQNTPHYFSSLHGKTYNVHICYILCALLLKACFWFWHLGHTTIKNNKTTCEPRRPGAVAWSEASSLGMQAAPSSIPTSGTFFRGDLVMKTFLRPFSLFHWFKKSSCQLLAKECALSTGKLPRRLAQEQCG